MLKEGNFGCCLFSCIGTLSRSMSMQQGKCHCSIMRLYPTSKLMMLLYITRGSLSRHSLTQEIPSQSLSSPGDLTQKKHQFPSCPKPSPSLARRCPTRKAPATQRPSLPKRKNTKGGKGCLKRCDVRLAVELETRVVPFLLLSLTVRGRHGQSEVADASLSPWIQK